MLLLKLVVFSLEFLSLKLPSNAKGEFILNRHIGRPRRRLIFKFFSLILVPSFLADDILEITIRSQNQKVKEEATNENLDDSADDGPHHNGCDGVVTSY